MVERIMDNLKRNQILIGSTNIEYLQMVLAKVLDLIEKNEKKFSEIKEELSRKIDYEDISNEIIKKNNEFKEMYLIKERSENFAGGIYNIQNEKSKESDEYSNKMSQDLEGKISENFKKLSENLQSQLMANSTSINKLNDSISEISNKQDDFVSELAVLKEIFRDLDINNFNDILKKVDKLENDVETIGNSISSVHEHISVIHKQMQDKNDKLNLNFNRTISSPTKQVGNIHEKLTYDPMLGEELSTSDMSATNLAKLNLTDNRNSGRLDNTNYALTSIREEVENISQAMIHADHTVQQFNRAIYDCQSQLSNMGDEILTRFMKIEPFVKWIGTNIHDLWVNFEQSSVCLAHLASSTQKSIEELFNFAVSSSNISLQKTYGLEEIAIESSSIKDQLHEKRANIDFEEHYSALKPVFKQEWNTQIVIKPLQDIPEFRANMKLHPTSTAEESDDTKSTPSTVYRDEPKIMITLEEIMVKLDQIEKKLPIFTDKVSEIVNLISSKIDRKIDTADADRIFEKIHRMINRVKHDIDNQISQSTASVSTSSSMSNLNTLKSSKTITTIDSSTVERIPFVQGIKIENSKPRSISRPRTANSFSTKRWGNALIHGSSYAKILASDHVKEPN